MTVNVTFIEANGNSTTTQAPEGRSFMQAAKTAGVAGIVAECGGNAMCATCHVYIPTNWQEKMPEVDMVESEMLDYAACERTDESRLSCQVFVTAELDGIEVRLPESQV